MMQRRQNTTAKHYARLQNSRILQIRAERQAIDYDDNLSQQMRVNNFI